MTQAEREAVASSITGASQQLREALADLEMALCSIILGYSHTHVCVNIDRAEGLVKHAQRYMKKARLRKSAVQAIRRKR